MSGYARALTLLPVSIRQRATGIPSADISEFRLRKGFCPTVLTSCGEREIPGCSGVNASDLGKVVENATLASPYTVRQSMESGYIAAAGGVRIGVCGELRPSAEGRLLFGAISSLCIRVPREIRGCGDRWCRAPFESTLILSPPGLGKTTLLRDMIRQLSGFGQRIGLCDERGEVACLCNGTPGFDVGPHTDILTGIPKGDGAMMLLRTMNPEIIAMDEITASEDAAACSAAANCGVRLLATAHGDDPDDLCSRELYRTLISGHIFKRLILITRNRGVREYREYPL